MRKLRKKCDFNQEELAHRAGLSTVYISLLERGLRHPSLDTVFELAQALSISAAELVACVEADLKQID